jgi:undecaprenyl-phosphate 4-deoxy-4-formamido-L-arabinose transferase
MLSIIIPVYNSEKTIEKLTDELSIYFDKYELQIVLVNDGSRDNSHEVCLNIANKYSHFVCYINLSRNFGEHNAVMAGLNYARGEYAVIMDDDFQNPPDEVITLFNTARDGNYDIVYSCYEEKKHNIFRNLVSRLHNQISVYMLNKPKDLYLSSFKCINRFAIDQVIQYKGPYPYIDGLLLRCTQRIGKVKVLHSERKEGSSGYTIRKLLRLWMNMFLNFSILPLRISSFMGLVISLSGFIMAMFVIIEKFQDPNIPIGWPSTIVIVTVFSGIQLFILGLIGEYLGTMFLGFNLTPQYIVRDVIDNNKEE